MNVNHGSIEKSKKYDVIIKTNFWGVGDVAQLLVCLPGMQEALDPISNTTSTGCDDTCLGSQFSEGGDRRIRSGKTTLLHSKFKGSLVYMRPFAIKEKIFLCLKCPIGFLLATSGKCARKQERGHCILEPLRQHWDTIKTLRHDAH